MGKEASLKQVVRLIELVVESGWSREEFQRRFIERFGLIRQISEAIDELGENRVRAMHPLFYRKGEVTVRSTKPALPAEMTIGSRTYEILSFFREREDLIGGDLVVGRAREMRASIGQEDCEFLLVHQDEIPAAFRGMITFVFTDWRHPDARDCVAFVHWDKGQWTRYWYRLDYIWRSGARFLRRKDDK